MPTIPARPEGANATDPSAPPWRPSNPDRWGQLGLADSNPHARLPEQGSTADLLAFALVPPGATDPVEGILDGVRIELSALADVAPTPAIADALHLATRRLDVAALLLARCDNRAPHTEPEPPQFEEEAFSQAQPPTPAGPAEPAQRARKRGRKR